MSRYPQVIRWAPAIAALTFGAMVFGPGGNFSTTFPGAAQAQGGAPDDTPSGGGYGCRSRGDCNGSLYSNPANLNSWWYPICSGCHSVQAPPPPNLRVALSPNQRKVISDSKAFWNLHDQAKPDPVLRKLLPRQALKPIGMVPQNFRGLTKP